MITEDYVSFETAKLLKEKGFNEECSFAFYKDGRIVDRYDSEFSYNYYDRPTLQMAMKWLREVHNIHIIIESIIRTYGDTEYYYKLYGTKNKSICVVCDIYKGETWNNNEEACEEAIKYCLENLI